MGCINLPQNGIAPGPDSKSCAKLTVIEVVVRVIPKNIVINMRVSIL